MPENVVTHALRGEGFDASEDGTGRGTPLVPVAYAATDYESGAFDRVERAAPLTTSADRTRAAPILAFDTTQVTSAENRSNPKAGDPCHPLAAGAHAPAIAFQERGREDGRSLEIGGELAYALTAPKDGGRSQERNILTPTMQVRRLTPMECERLQGFPDGYTAITVRGKPAADGPRYKSLGNSWAIPCVRWIGERINAVEALAIQEAA